MPYTVHHWVDIKGTRKTLREKKQNGAIPIGHNGALEVYHNLQALFLVTHPKLETVLGWSGWKLSIAHEWLKNTAKPTPRFLRRYR